MLPHWLLYRTLGHLYDRIKAHEDGLGITLGELDRVCPIGGADIVELGCGSGYLTRKLASRAHSVRAYDRIRHMVRVARRLARSAGLGNCTFGIADHRSIPAPDDSADIVIAGWTILSLVSEEWESDWAPALDLVIHEARRLLKDGGTILVVETTGLMDELPGGQVYHPRRRAFLEYLESHHGFGKTWFRNEWRYDSLAQAVRLISLFHGRWLSRQVRDADVIAVPEHVGIWWWRLGA